MRAAGALRVDRGGVALGETERLAVGGRRGRRARDIEERRAGEGVAENGFELHSKGKDDEHR